MSKKRMKLERSINNAVKRRDKKWKGARAYKDADTLKAALDNARHHNNQHRPKPE
jgi:hypothetical protein